MREFPELFPGVRIGAQPTDTDLAELKRLGVRTVVDFRQPRETETSNEQLVDNKDLRYVNIPVDRDNPSVDAVDRLDEVMERHPEPVLLHCGSGIRAITIYLLRKARAQDWSPEQVEQEITGRGYDLSSHPALQRLIRAYLS